MKRYFLILLTAIVLFSISQAPAAEKSSNATKKSQFSLLKNISKSFLNGRIIAVQQNLIGEITAIDSKGGKITLKTESGNSVTVSISDKTLFRRVAPGQTSITNAEKISFAEIKVGDRILIPGGSKNEPTFAQQIIVMAREAISLQRDQQLENRKARTINGRVIAINPQNREIIIQTRAGGTEVITVTVSASENVKFLRFAPDSLKVSDAVAGSFSDVGVGNYIRIIGERSAEGTRITAEEIVSGSFSRTAGSIVGVNAARNEITVKNSQTGRTTMVTVGKNTTLRRIPDDIAKTLKQLANQNAERQRASPDRPNPINTSAQKNERQQGRDSTNTAQQLQSVRISQLFENLPPVTLSELKKGDAILITGTGGTDNSRMTAVSIITGESELQQILLRAQGGRIDLSPTSPGLPGNVGGGNNVGDDEPRN